MSSTGSAGREGEGEGEEEEEEKEKTYEMRIIIYKCRNQRSEDHTREYEL